MGDEVGDSAQSQVHMSADDLNDGFILDKEDKKTLSYQVSENRFYYSIICYYRIYSIHIFLSVQDGKWNIGEESGDDKDEDEEGGESDEEEESEAEEDDGDEEEEEGEEEDDEEQIEDEEQEGGSEEEEEEDGHSDLDSEQESEDGERKQEDEETSAKPSTSLSKEELKAQQEAAKAELPYTFTGNYTLSLI